MAQKAQDQQPEEDNQTEATAESHTDVHVESHSEQHVSSDAPPTAGPAAADDQLAQLTADLQRAQADFINYRRRAEAEKADALNFATSRVAREFLAVRDSFDAEAAHRPADADPQWAKSIDAIRAQFDQVLNNLGITRFESVGQPFDPHRHEAVAHDGDGDTVTAELQSGYQMGDTVIRPAIVKVGSAPKN